MYLSAINIINFRSIEAASLELSKLNILVGANNSGKSSVLKAIHLMQSAINTVADIRSGRDYFTITAFLNDIPRGHPLLNGTKSITSGSFTLEQDHKSGLIHRFQLGGSPNNQVKPFPNNEPDHLIIPFLSRRKAAGYQEDVRAQHTLSIANDLQYLAAKLSRISNPGYPMHEQYKATCTAVLGFMVGAIPSENGLRPGIYLPNMTTLSIEQMGEGVSNIAALLIYLAEARGKVFLIEELENDLHPKALKSLLDLIIASSEHNQFIISTHSNIVVRHLASVEGSKLYNVTTVPNILPTEAEINLVPSTVESRMEVLQDLGYSFSDFDLWDGWLIVEEASAERIIRDYLIPWFVPELTRVRTISTKGADEVEPMFKDWNRLVCYSHLEEVYRNRAWVRVDGDEKGQGIIKHLKNSYKTWIPDRFSTYEHPQFEKYYPIEFTEAVNAVFNIPNKKERQEEKKKLSEKVRAWLDEDTARGKAALKASAKEIIDDLKLISAQLKLVEQA